MQLISLDASPSSDLKWETESAGTYFLDFHFEDLDPFDQGQFHAHLFAVEEFTRQFPHAKQVALAKVGGKFWPLLKKSAQMEEMIHENKVDREIFSAQLFSEYLHRLASALPEETTPLLLCDIPEEEKIEHLVMPFCRRRFEHFSLCFLQKTIPIEGDAPLIVVLPQDTEYRPAVFSQIFESFRKEKFKCIPEELLNEHWDGVDLLVVEPSSLGKMGQRMLCGFEAAGGTIFYTNMTQKSE